MVHYFFNSMLLFTIIIFRADPSKYGDAIQSGTHVSPFEHAFMAIVKVKDRQQAAALHSFAPNYKSYIKLVSCPCPGTAASQYMGWIIQGSILGRERAILFLKISRLAPGCTQPPIQWEPGVLSLELKWPGPWPCISI